MKSLRNFGIVLSILVFGTLGIGAGSACADSNASDGPGEPKNVQPLPDAGVSEATPDVKSEVRNHSGFDQVSVGGAMTAKITAGQNFEVIVEAEADVLPKVISKVEDNRLIIRMEKNWWKSMKGKYKRSNVRVTISLPELKDVDISGASKATVSGINNDSLTIDVSGASDVSIEGIARSINVDLSGASRLKAENLYSEVAEIDLSGASSAKLSVSSELNVDASGASSVRYVGEPRVTKDTSGSSSVSKQ